MLGLSAGQACFAIMDDDLKEIWNKYKGRYKHNRTNNFAFITFQIQI